MNDHAGFIRKFFCQKLVNLGVYLPKDNVAIYIGKKKFKGRNQKKKNPKVKKDRGVY